MACFLIVDDDGVSRLLLRHMLEAEGHSVVDASDVDEAMAVAQEQPEFDVVVSDFEMPGGTGLDLQEQLTAAGIHAQFVLVTGHQERTEFSDPRIDLVDAFLTKPVSSGALAECVGTVLTPAG